jgi:cytochrome P450
MSEPEARWGDWTSSTRNDPYPLFESMRAMCPVHQVRLADGNEAWLVLGYAGARQALKDGRISKDMLAALDHDPDVVDAGLPGPTFARHMLAVDPPDHTRLRGLVSKAFAPSRIAALEPELVKHFETRSCYAVCAASSLGSLIQATVGSFGGSGWRCRNRAGLAA